MSNVLVAEETTAVRAWSAPQVEGPLANRRRDWRKLGELEEIERLAWDESYAAGHQAGLAAGRAELDAANVALAQRIASFDAFLMLLSRPLTRMDEQVERQLVELSLTIARHLLRRELRTDPAQVIAIIRETVGLLPAAARDVHVHLHPQDAALLRERLAPTSTGRAWSILEDPVLARGDCRVTADAAEIDARLETRLNAVMGSLLGEERSAARSPANAESAAAPGGELS